MKTKVLEPQSQECEELMKRSNYAVPHDADTELRLLLADLFELLVRREKQLAAITKAARMT